MKRRLCVASLALTSALLIASPAGADVLRRIFVRVVEELAVSVATDLLKQAIGGDRSEDRAPREQPSPADRARRELLSQPVTEAEPGTRDKALRTIRTLLDESVPLERRVGLYAPNITFQSADSITSRDDLLARGLQYRRGFRSLFFDTQNMTVRGTEMTTDGNIVAIAVDVPYSHVANSGKVLSGTSHNLFLLGGVRTHPLVYYQAERVFRD